MRGVGCAEGDRLNWADGVIVLILSSSVLVGLLRGFVREATSVAFWVVGLWAAWHFEPMVEPHLGGLLADPHVAPLVGRLAILTAVLAVGWLVGLLLDHFLSSAGLRPVDRMIGLVFGVVRGTVLVALLVIGGELLHLNHESWWNRSTLIPYGESAGDWLRAMVGERGEPWATLDRLAGRKRKVN